MRIPLPDGRELDTFAAGVEHGRVVVFHHGTPSAAEDHRGWIDLAAARGWGWVSWSRPGYAGSTRRPGRSVAGVADDARAVLDHLGVRRCVTIGWSGGGPHALACGARLGRCAAVGLIASVAPYAGAAAAGLDWLAGMGDENVAEFGAATTGEAALRAWLAANGEPARTVTGPEIAGSLGDLVDEVDRAALTGAFAERVARSFRTALAPGFDGWVDDDLAFVRDWGFALGDVGVPVGLWQGTDDRMVPFGHGEWLAPRLPHVSPHLLDGEGHLSIALGRFEALLDEVLAAAG